MLVYDSEDSIGGPMKTCFGSSEAHLYTMNSRRACSAATCNLTMSPLFGAVVELPVRLTLDRLMLGSSRCMSS